MHATTKAKALSALEGMREIVQREMLVKGAYVAQDVTNPDLKAAVCGGRKHCAVGSLWAGGGVRPTRTEWNDIILPGADQEDRDAFLRPRHGLRAAYDALNTAADSFADRRGLDPDDENDYFTASVERLFESHYGDGLTKRDLLNVIAAAKRQIKNAA